MTKKKLVVILEVIFEIMFIIGFWYTYYLYKTVLNLTFAIIISTVVIGTILKPYLFKNSKSNNNHRLNMILKQPLWLILICCVPIFLFFLIMGYVITYGGSAVTLDYANEYIESYEVGKYFLSNKGVYIEVSFKIWNLIRILEHIWVASIIFAVVSIFVKLIISKKDKEIVGEINYAALDVINGFKNTSDLILAKWKTTGYPFNGYEYAFPYVVNACFCCEVLIKRELMKSNRIIPSGHDIKKLFNKLDDKQKNTIKSKMYGKPNLSKKEEKEFTEKMTNVRKGFEKFRYSFEDNKNPTFDSSKGSRIVNNVEIDVDFLDAFLNALYDLLRK